MRLGYLENRFLDDVGARTVHSDPRCGPLTGVYVVAVAPDGLCRFGVLQLRVSWCDQCTDVDLVLPAAVVTSGPVIPEPVSQSRDWMDAAACLGRDGIDWMVSTDAAFTLCGGCPVRGECAAYGDAIAANVGVWGGVDRRVLELV